MKTKLFLIVMVSMILILGAHASCFAVSVVLQWDPNTDADLAGYKVYYKADSSAVPFDGAGAASGVSPVDVHNQTNATISGLDPNHSYYFAVTAYNKSGVESGYSNIVAITESAPPIVSITSPTNNSSASGTVSVAATASDNVGVTKVEYYVDGTLQATDTSTPYLYSWNTASVAPGGHTLTAKAYDAAGNVGQSTSVSVTVVNDTTAPTVSMTTPANNATVSGTTTITATASDNVGVTKVEFYDNGTLLYATNVSPYTYSWDTKLVADGSHVLYAKAYDASGNSGQSSNISVTVNNPVSDTTAPTVSMTTPANNATVSGTTTITATASDNVGVTKVEFYDNGTLLYTTNVSPYSYSWNTTLVANGAHSLYAKAYDAAGNLGQSPNVNLTIANNAATSSPLSISDAVLALQISAGSVHPTSDQMTRLDVAPVINGVSVPNGQVDTGDVIVILSKVVGKIAL